MRVRDRILRTGHSSRIACRGCCWRCSSRCTSGCCRSALTAPSDLERALRFVDRPVFKVAEWGLVVLLAAHLAFGMRVLVLELLPWRSWQKSLIAIAVLITVVAGIAMALNLV